MDDYLLEFQPDDEDEDYDQDLDDWITEGEDEDYIEIK